MDKAEAQDIEKQMLKEAQKYGTVKQMMIPQPAKDGSEVEGVGKVFIHFESLTAARKFLAQTNGRLFMNRVVCASFYPEGR